MEFITRYPLLITDYSVIMIITIYGEDTFRSREFLNSTIDQFKKKRDPQGFNIHWVDAMKTSLHEIAQQEGTGGLFGSDKRLFIVEQIEEAKVQADDIHAFVEARESQEGNVVCFYVRGKLSSVLNAQLGKGRYVYPFSLLTGLELERWVNQRALGYCQNVSSAVVRKLIQRFQSDLWALDRELASLSALSSGRSIGEQEYQTRESSDHEYTSFALVEAVLQGKRGVVAEAIPTIQPNDWIPLIMLLSSHIRGIRWLKESLRGGDSRSNIKPIPLNPFFLKKLSTFEPRLSVMELRSWVDALIETDTYMKTTSVEASTLAVRKLFQG